MRNAPFCNFQKKIWSRFTYCRLSLDCAWNQGSEHRTIKHFPSQAVWESCKHAGGTESSHFALQSLYIAIPLYFVVLACRFLGPYRKTDKMKKERVNDALSAHYLAGWSCSDPWSHPTLCFCLAIFGIHSSAWEFPTKRSSQDVSLFDAWQVSCIAIVFGFMGTGLRPRKKCEK